jgi:hypothetical protein
LSGFSVVLSLLPRMLIGDGLSVDLAGAAFGAGRCGAGRSESKPLIKGPAPRSQRRRGWPAPNVTSSATPGPDTNRRIASVTRARPAPACARVRRPRASARDRRGAWRWIQAAQQAGLAGVYRDQGRAPAGVPVEDRAETRVTGCPGSASFSVRHSMRSSSSRSRRMAKFLSPRSPASRNEGHTTPRVRQLPSVTSRRVTRTRAEGPHGCDSARRPVPAARTSRSRPLPRDRWDGASGHRRRNRWSRAGWLVPPARRAAPAGPADPA